MKWLLSRVEARTGTLAMQQHRGLMRCQSAQQQLLLFNPAAVPTEAVEELQGLYGFRPRQAAGCLADIMISQRKSVYPPVAFMLLEKLSRHVSPEQHIERLEKAEKAFAHVFVIVVQPFPSLMELQRLHIVNGLKIKLYTATSISSAVKLMVTVHEKLHFEITERAQTVNQQMDNQLISRAHALKTLRINFRFLSVDECDMLLDLFGTISELSQASAADILDRTVLGAAAAQAIEEFFHSEYVVDP